MQTASEDLQLLIQKRRLERVKRFTDNMNARTLQISLGGQTGLLGTKFIMVLEGLVRVHREATSSELWETVEFAVSMLK